jgi:hypothetical protein
MAIGRQPGILRAIEHVPRRGPQSFTVAMLLGDVLGWTRGERAAELSVIPKRTHTYFGAYKPGTAQRIPPVINTGYGSQYPTDERVRVALVARARMFASSLLIRGADGTSPADAADSQASRIAQAN